MEIDTKYKILFGVLVLGLFTYGIFLGIRISKTKDEENVDVIANENLIYDEDNKSVETISKKYDIELVYEDRYTLCNEIVTKKETIYDTTLDELKEKEEEKQEKEGKVYKIKEESNEKLVYSRNIDENCPSHFLALLEDTVINIYRNVDDDTKTFYRKIDTQDKLIRDDVKEELTKGIKFDYYEELNLFIEDLES